MTGAWIPYRSGDLGGVTYDGSEYPAYFFIYLADLDYWEGPGDTAHACTLYFDMASSSTSWDSGLVGDGAWAAWALDLESSYATEEGPCDDLDPSDWTTNVVRELSGYDWSYGIGPVDSDLGEILTDSYPEYEDNWLGGWLDTDFGGGGAGAVDYGIAYEVDSSGEVDDSSMLDVSGWSTAEDGLYLTYSGYYFPL